MGKTYAIQYHPLPLRYWLHEHHRLVGSSLALIVLMLAVAVVAVSFSTVQEAIAERTDSPAIGAELGSATALPNEWTTWSREPITFDHMYRDSGSNARMDFIRSPSRVYYGSSE